MHFKKLHPWKVSVKEALNIQRDLRKTVVLENKSLNLRRIAAVDVGYSDIMAKAVVCVFSFPQLKLLETEVTFQRVNFPYIPGLLSFREGPAILKTFRKIKNIPDLILFDGQGILHPRRMGLATHMGIILDLPTVGCAKSILFGRFNLPKDKRGSFSYIYDEQSPEILGIALRTRGKVKPVFVSCGYKIDLERVKEIVLNLTFRYRIPEPLRIVHSLTKDGTV
ncbi:MAG: endonuclease V [Candidatus Omnitrophica bacterium]|nr:endonuclease V [Candidatus Omnitrophota bacterium]